MKIRINYDLIDKVSEANKGYSLKRCVKRTMGAFGISSAVTTPMTLARDQADFLIFGYLIQMMVHTSATLSYTIPFIDISKKLASKNLHKLANELHAININVNYEALLDAYKDSCEYKLNTDGKLEVLQKKYITVPYHTECFGDGEVSLLQEHIIGSRDYDLSFGSPQKKEKIYSLGKRILER